MKRQDAKSAKVQRENRRKKCSRQGDYPRERFVAKSGMKRFFHRQDAKFAKPN
jgi:hypothetical protein